MYGVESPPFPTCGFLLQLFHLSRTSCSGNQLLTLQSILCISNFRHTYYMTWIKYSFPIHFLLKLKHVMETCLGSSLRDIPNALSIYNLLEKQNIDLQLNHVPIQLDPNLWANIPKFPLLIRGIPKDSKKSPHVNTAHLGIPFDISFYICLGIEIQEVG